MDLASAVLKKVLVENNIEVWSRLKSDLFFSTRLKELFKQINGYFSTNCALPSFDILEAILRDKSEKETFAAVMATDVPESSDILFEYLKAEYAQSLILEGLKGYLKNSVSHESAEDSISSLQEIVLDVQYKAVDSTSAESMQRIELFEPEENLNRYMSLGLNDEYDAQHKFGPGDLILLGAKRGGGKSLVCCNLATRYIETQGKSVLYFTIEMPTRQILHRCAAISTGVEPKKFRELQASMTPEELSKVAHWWSSRYDKGEEAYREFITHKSFTKLHTKLITNPLINPRLEIIYDPSLTLTKVKSELAKKVKELDVGLVIVDYINKVKRTANGSGQFDWTEQIEISNELKEIGQDFGVVMVSPYQMDATGEARFAKGILDAADAAFTLDKHKDEDDCFSFNCVKMRQDKEVSFHSRWDQNSLRIGPLTATPPETTTKALKNSKKNTTESEDTKIEKQPKEKIEDIPPW